MALSIGTCGVRLFDKHAHAAPGDKHAAGAFAERQMTE